MNFNINVIRIIYGKRKKLEHKKKYFTVVAGYNISWVKKGIKSKNKEQNQNKRARN